MPTKPGRLRDLIAGGGPLIAPGAYDAITGLLIEAAGFDLVYATGGGIARSMGYPDIGLVSFSEMVARVTEIAQRCSLPVIADADTGYGNALNVIRTVQAYERAGVAGLHLEDQVFPKRCGHYEGQTIVPVEEMAGKIQAAVAARSDPDLFIIARTDARAVNGTDEAIARAQAYVDAGADGIFVEAPRSEQEVQQIANAVNSVLIYNMTDSGKSPMLPAARLAQLGYQIILFPSQLQRAGLRAMQDVLAGIRESGQLPAASEMISFQARDKIIDHAKYLEWEQRYVR